MRRRILLASAAVLVAFTGCRHRCHKPSDRADRLPPGAIPVPPNLPPPNVPTTPSVQPAPSGFLPPAATTPLPAPTPKTGGPEVLFPDPLPPGSSSSRPVQPGPNVIGAPVRPQTAEPPKASGTTGLPGYTKVRDGLFAGRKPALDGFDQLKSNGFRSVIFLHAAGADVSAVKDMASTRGLNFVAIETTPETLADASKQFERVAGDRLTRSAYVFADDPQRAGAVWYLYFRTTLAEGDDVARLSAKPLGLSDAGDEGKAFALAIQRVLETR